MPSLAEYGTVDEKKSLVANEEFHALMLKLADALGLKTVEAVDPVSGAKVGIAGSIEVKGIRGSDKRPYIVDLQGLTPRDANYKGDQYHTALVRPELLNRYQRYRGEKYATENIKPFVEKLEKDRKPDPKPEEGKELTDVQKREIAKQRQEEALLRMKEFDRLAKTVEPIKFNANVFKQGATLALSADELKADEKDVEELAAFLKDVELPSIARELR